MAALADADVKQESPATMPNASSTPILGDAAGADGPSQTDDTASTITVNTKAPAAFPPPKTDKPRPHVCATCQRSFARLEHLKRHERSHTKEKPFECPECARCFARRDLLLRHQQKLHQTTTPSSRPRNRRESTSGAVPGQSRARKGSVAGGNAAGTAVSVTAPMRPRANTISHVDGTAMHMMTATNASAARTLPQTHSRHASLVGLPIHNLDHTFGGMSATLGHRGVNHDLPRLETHSINMDFSGGLRTAPPMAVLSPEFDFEGMLFGPGNTINPNALHYNDSPQAMAVDSTSPFSHGLQDISAGQQLDDSFDWLTGFEHQMSFNGANDNAVDGSSPSAISTTSQSGISDVMLDGSNQPASTAPATSAMWQPAVMGPPQITTNLFSLDVSNSVFPDLMNGAPVSPQPPAQKNVGDAYFSTPPPSLSSMSPSVMPGLNPQNLNHALSFGAGPETPTSMNGINHGTSPVATITDSTRNAILGALSSAASLSSPFAGRKHSFTMPASPLSPLGPATSSGLADPAGSLPTTHDLQRYVGAYLRYFQPHMPFLHVPTLSFEIPAQSTSLASTVGGPACLVLSMASIGALYEMEPSRSRELFEMAKKMIQTYLEQRRKANVGKAGFRGAPAAASQGPHTEHHADTPLWLVQAMLLNVMYGHHCGEKRAGEIASTHCAALVSLAQGAALFRPVRLSGNSDEDTKMADLAGDGSDASRREAEEQAAWLRWKAAEERKRTLYAIFILSSLLISAYNHAPALTNSEVFLDLPCDEEFFAAENGVAFSALGGVSAASHNCAPFHEVLGEILRMGERQYGTASSGNHGPPRALVSAAEPADSAGKTSSLGCLVLIHALHNYLWETRQRHHEAWTQEETEKMHSHIEPALRAWQAAWASSPKHSLERPTNTFSLGILSADAIPLFDSAHVRLFVDLSRPREKFWQRDWDGMAGEMSRGSEPTQRAEHLLGPKAETTAAEAAQVPAASSAVVGSLASQPTATDFPPVKLSPLLWQNAPSQASTRDTSRREKYLRKAAFYAVDSLSVADKLGTTLGDLTNRELPLQSAMCVFDCAQVLAEWVATLQDRVGRYVGVLGQDEVDLTQVPAIMLLEDEDAKLLGRIQEVLNLAEMKLSLDLPAASPWVESDLRAGEWTGYAAKILRVTAYMFNRAAVWPVVRLMAQSLEAHASHMRSRAEKSVMPAE